MCWPSIIRQSVIKRMNKISGSHMNYTILTGSRRSWNKKYTIILRKLYDHDKIYYIRLDKVYLGVALRVRVQLGLGSVHLGVGCNFVAIKVRLEFQNIFGPSIFTLLDRPLWHFLTVHFIASGPSTLTLSDRPLWHFRTVHFDPSIFPKDRPLLVEWPPTLTHDRPLWLKWPSSLAQDRPLSRDRPTSPFWTVHFGPDSYK